jgi:hypothetical protein
MGVALMSSTVIVSVLGPALFGLAGAALRSIARKIDRVGEHLHQQDLRARRYDQRLVRLEEHAGLHPLPPAENGPMMC